MTTPREVPHGQQLADAQTALDHATRRYADAQDAARTARTAYARTRQADPAAQTTDQARHAWTEAAHDLADAVAAMERSRDHLTHLYRQPTEAPTHE